MESETPRTDEIVNAPFERQEDDRHDYVSGQRNGALVQLARSLERALADVTRERDERDARIVVLDTRDKEAKRLFTYLLTHSKASHLLSDGFMADAFAFLDTAALSAPPKAQGDAP